MKNQNNTWHTVNNDTDTVIIFVHGFFSSAEKCWKPESSSISWPDLIKDDSRIPPAAIYLGGYYTDFDSKQYGFSDCATELFRALQRTSAEGVPAPLSKKNLVFVCHSLGGIVTRHMLHTYQSYFSAHKIGLVLMASPSLGSDYADSFVKLIKLYGNKLGGQLQFKNQSLLDLDESFKIFLDTRNDQNLVGVEGIEHKGPFNMRFLPLLKPIVLKESAARYFNRSETIPSTDHSSIVKPTELNHPSHNFLVDFFESKFNKICPPHLPSALPPATAEVTSFSRGALFDIYDEKCEPYYLNRNIDNQIKQDYSVASFWVFGPSGTGKTSAINRLLSIQGANVVAVCFSQCGSDSPRNGYIEEIIDTLCIETSEFVLPTAKTYRHLTTILVKRINKTGSMTLYIDEVPVNDSHPENELLILIEDLLTSIKQLTQKGHLTIIVSSIERPNFSVIKNLQKFSQYLLVREFEVWSNNDLENLINLILPQIPPDASQNLNPKDLVGAASGSPRFIKTFFINKIANPAKSDSELVLMTVNLV